MSAVPHREALQGTLFDFAIAELVRQHRTSFQPLWSRESWAKLLIWLALNCGCSGDERSLQAFAEALGPVLTARLRRVFFERELEGRGLRLLADPAEPQVLVLPLAPGGDSLAPEAVASALAEAQLLQLLRADRSHWQWHEAAVAIPWA
jgi:hypothetical protein